MNGTNGDEWNELSRRWRSDAPPMPSPGEIRSRLRAKRRRLAATWTMDLVITVALSAFVAYQVVRHPNPVTWLWAGGIAVFTLCTLIFVFINRRGLWPAPTEDLQAYIRRARRHCRSRRRTILFSWWIYIAELAFILGFFVWVGLPADGWLLVGSVLAAFTLGLALWTLWFGQRVRAERRYLDTIEERNSMDGEDPL